MKTTTDCPECGTSFTRVHTVNTPPKFCSRACANRAPGRMTLDVRLRIGGRDSPKSKGGHLARGGSGKTYHAVYVKLADRHLHPTVHRKGTILRSHLVWDLAHPDDPVKKGEVIHHKNENSHDDRIENLEKLPSQSPHARHHFSQPRGPMSEAHKAALSRAKRKLPDRDCEHCGQVLAPPQISTRQRFCSRACGYAWRTGKPMSEWKG